MSERLTPDPHERETDVPEVTVVTDHLSEDPTLFALNKKFPTLIPETTYALKSSTDLIDLWLAASDGTLRDMLDADSDLNKRYLHGHPIEDVIEYFGAPRTDFLKILWLVNITSMPKHFALVLKTLYEQPPTRKPSLIIEAVASARLLLLAVQLARAAHIHIKKGKRGIAAVGLFFHSRFMGVRQAAQFVTCLTWGTAVTYIKVEDTMDTKELLARCVSERPQILLGHPCAIRKLLACVSKETTDNATLLTMEHWDLRRTGCVVSDIQAVIDRMTAAKLEVYSISDDWVEMLTGQVPDKVGFAALEED